MDRRSSSTFCGVRWRVSSRQPTGSSPKFHLTMERLAVLREVVTAHAPLDMKAVARRLSVAPGTLTGLVRRLIDDGYALHIPDGFDRRVKIVHVTPKGLFAAAAASSAIALTAEHLTGTLSRHDRSVLVQALTRIAEPLRGPSCEVPAAAEVTLAACPASS